MTQKALTIITVKIIDVCSKHNLRGVKEKLKTSELLNFVMFLTYKNSGSEYIQNLQKLIKRKDPNPSASMSQKERVCKLLISEKTFNCIT